MDKKILSAAIIAALAAPVAAVADTTLYGQLHMSAGALDDEGVFGAPTDSMQVRSHASRLGVKGSEDLGGGLKANFLLEWEVNPDETGDTTSGNDAGFARRNQWVGLSGDNWGEVRVGRHDTPLKMAQGKFDQFNDMDGDIGNIFQGEIRSDNVLAYLSPNWNGLSFAAAGIAGEATLAEEAAGNDKTGLTDIYSLAAMYSNGPLFVSLAYDDYDATAGSGASDNLFRAVATYQFGDLQVGGLYTMGEDECNSCDNDGWGLSAKYSIGNIDLKGQYLDATYEDGLGNPDIEGQLWSLGVDYNFSKRTTAYFVFTQGEEEIGAASTEGDYTAVGVIHKF
jgi:predicted porin